MRQEEWKALHQLLEEKNGHMAKIQSIDARVLDCLARNSPSSASAQPSASRPVLSKGFLKKDESIRNRGGDATANASALPTPELPHRSIERSSEPRAQELPRASSAQPAGLPVTELLPASPARPAVLPATDALTVVYRVMADKTGYDVSMIDEEMDLEADLGIDSIKRVEILGAAQEALGITVRDLDALGRTKTVEEVIGFLRREMEGTRKGHAQAAPRYDAAPQARGSNASTLPRASPAQPVAPPAPELPHASFATTAALPAATPNVPAAAVTPRSMPDALTVVYRIMADKTGYDVSMIGEEMDLEADLGIDSIKRVEILGAAQEMLAVKVQDLDALGRTRTVGEVVAFLGALTQSFGESQPTPSVSGMENQ